MEIAMSINHDRLNNRYTRIGEALLNNTSGCNVVVTLKETTASLRYLIKKVGCLRVSEAAAGQIRACDEGSVVVEGWIPSSHYEFFKKSLLKGKVLRYCETQ